MRVLYILSRGISIASCFTALVITFTVAMHGRVELGEPSPLVLIGETFFATLGVILNLREVIVGE